MLWRCFFPAMVALITSAPSLIISMLAEMFLLFGFEGTAL